MQPWYLDVVCTGGNWDAATVESGGRTIAAMPFFLKKKWGWNYIAMPPLCKFTGPYLLPEYRNPDDEIRLYDALTDQLPPKLAAFEQDMNYRVINWLPFYWKGFRQTTRYSYIIDLRQSEAEIRENSTCKLFFALDAENRVHSAALLAWDKHSAYYIMSGDDPALRASGSALLLKWTAIMYAKNTLNLNIFDFEGSMIRAIEAGRRDFGARQTPYFRIQKEWSPLWKIGKWLFR